MDTDICVIGGGPSGASAAIQLRNLGYRVCLIERQGTRRPMSAESFPETIVPLLGELGVLSLVGQGGLTCCQRTLVRWAAAEEKRPISAFLADRSRFDLVLLQAARLAGAIVLVPARCRKTTWDQGRWTVAADSSDGRTQVSARFLVDATGRGGDQAQLGPNTVALCGRWGGVSVPGRPEMRIEAGEHGWLWAAPLSDGSLAVTCFLDALRCAGLDRATRLRLYRKMVACSSIGAVLGSADLVGEITVRDAACRRAADSVRSQTIKVGDRAFAMDPLSSQGTLTALQSGIQASIVVNTILRGGDADAAMTFYRDVQASAVRRHRRTSAEIYALQSSFSTAFWQERAAEGMLREATSRPAAALAPEACVRLSPEARLLKLPAIDGKEIRRKLSLSHPDLDRSVTWFSGVEVAPLLARVRPGCTTSSLLADWSQSVPADIAGSLVGWLVGAGILVGDPAPPTAVSAASS